MYDLRDRTRGDRFDSTIGRQQENGLVVSTTTPTNGGDSFLASPELDASVVPTAGCLVAVFDGAALVGIVEVVGGAKFVEVVSISFTFDVLETVVSDVAPPILAVASITRATATPLVRIVHKRSVPQHRSDASVTPLDVADRRLDPRRGRLGGKGTCHRRQLFDEPSISEVVQHSLFTGGHVNHQRIALWGIPSSALRAIDDHAIA